MSDLMRSASTGVAGSKIRIDRSGRPSTAKEEYPIPMVARIVVEKVADR